VLNIQTAGTTAIAIDASQAVTFAGAVSLSGNQTTTGNLTVNGNTTLGDASTDTILMTGAPSIGGAGLGMGMGFRNRIINGGMVIDQRNAGASVTPASGADTFPVDRFSIYSTQASKTTAQQNQGSVTPPAGFTNYLGVTSSSSYSVTSGDLFGLFQNIEGYNVADLGWGTANAKTVTLSFWVYSSLTGTFGGAVANSAQDRSYPFSYTISSANTWTQISITIPGDTTGTWLKTTGRGLTICWSLGMGSTRSGTANVWSSNTYFSTTGATSVVGTNGATFYITGVQLEKGATATSFDYRPYGTELVLCQRYYYTHASGATGRAGVGVWYSAAQVSWIVNYPVEMRAAPSIVVATGVGYYGCANSGNNDLLNTFLIYGSSTRTAEIYNDTQASGTAGQAGLVGCNNAASLIAFNSEL
jgi:hypothetical protein